MNVSLPDLMKAFIDEQVAARGYGSSSEYVRELVRRESDRLAMRDLLLTGATSGPAKAVEPSYFDDLRDQVRGRRSA